LPGLVLANQVATLGEEEGWVEAYTQATYAALNTSPYDAIELRELELA
jgi:hypothetical protein